VAKWEYSATRDQGDSTKFYVIRQYTTGFWWWKRTEVAKATLIWEAGNRRYVYEVDRTKFHNCGDIFDALEEVRVPPLWVEVAPIPEARLLR
jgi:hypothetical protein